ncbi:MAG TPA: hypothetical protein VED41_06940 [Solirubrobacteraceae bacterium]|nr:hypothetical protein [Solirubrobacteraceae bacterium]
MSAAGIDRARAAGRMSPKLALRDTAGVAKRNLLRIRRTPQLIVIAALQPAMLLFLFRYVTGGAIRVPGGRYVNYVVPAILIEAALIGGMNTSIGLAADLRSGIIDRSGACRWLARPCSRAARSPTSAAASSRSR